MLQVKLRDHILFTGLTVALSTHPPFKISIPLANIMAVELNSTSFADTIRMEIMDMDDMEDEV
jgi:hypothetical protein